MAAPDVVYEIWRFRLYSAFERIYIRIVRVLSKGTLRAFWQKHPDSKGPLSAWHSEVKAAKWKSFSDIRARFNSADWVGDGRVVFNIGGNNYRLVVRFDFIWQMAFVCFIGTHAEYDKIDAKTVIL